MLPDSNKKLAELRRDILELVEEYATLKEQQQIFIPNETPVPPSGKLLGSQEYCNLVEASLDGWLTTGRFNDAFEQRLSDVIGSKFSLTTNSGSSANLLAFYALSSPRLGERAIKAGDEVITVAAGFPTTVNPIIQFGCIPVFVDVEIGTYNIDAEQIESAISEKTKAIMLAHTLGNPFNIDEVLRIAKKYDLWVIEDCCDALGATYTPSVDFKKSRLDKVEKNKAAHVGTFGHLGTLSFYPAHHITMGEGGAVFTNSKQLNTVAESFRDWGRDCYCPPGNDDSCGKRFEWQLGQLPKGYDHKYIYSHAGFNLKITDMQAACGLAQLDKLSDFIVRRNRNFDYLYSHLSECTDSLVLPRATPRSKPSWFGFPLTVNSNKFTRLELAKFLDTKKIGTRQLFAGNLTLQPYLQNVKYKQVGDLENTNRVMRDTLWIGVQPSLSQEALNHTIKSIKQFINDMN